MKNNATNSPVLTLVYGAAIAAIYVVLTMVFLPISFGPIQFRISELLCVLPYFTPAAIPGLFIGSGKTAIWYLFRRSSRT